MITMLFNQSIIKLTSYTHIYIKTKLITRPPDNESAINDRKSVLSKTTCHATCSWESRALNCQTAQLLLTNRATRCVLKQLCVILLETFMGAEVNFQGHSLSPYLVLFPRFSEIMAENCEFF